jgi:hypothetical protein
VDAFTRDLELMEVISAADAMVNARGAGGSGGRRAERSGGRGYGATSSPCPRRRRSAWTGSTGACGEDPSVGALFRLLRNTREVIKLSTYPEGEHTGVDVESNDEAWLKDAEDWLARAFS